MPALGDYTNLNTWAQQPSNQQPSSQGTASPEFMKELQAAISSTPKPDAGSPTLGRVKDLGIDFVKGAVNLAQVPLGLADMAGLQGTNNAAKLGILPQKTHEILDQSYSPARQQTNKEVAEAEGAANVVKAYATHPSAIAGGVAQSLPLMLPGAAIAKGLGVAGKLAQLGAVAGSEGAVTTSLLATDAESKGIPHSQYAGPAALAGLGTAGIAMAAGGIGGDATVNLLRGNAGNKLLNIAKTMGSEGTEETLQSGSEKMQENRIYGKPLFEGVPEAMAAGGVIGAAQGGGMAAVTRQAINPQTGQGTGKTEVVNNESGSVVKNKSIQDAFNHFSQSSVTNHSSSEEYTKAKEDALSILDKIINPKSKDGTPMEADPIDSKDAQYIKNMIEQGHKAKTSADTRDSIRDSEINAADPNMPESFKPVSSMSDEELKNTHEVLYKMVSSIDQTAPDESGQKLINRFKEVDSALRGTTNTTEDFQTVDTPTPEDTIIVDSNGNATTNNGNTNATNSSGQDIQSNTEVQSSVADTTNTTSVNETTQPIVEDTVEPTATISDTKTVHSEVIKTDPVMADEVARVATEKVATEPEAVIKDTTAAIATGDQATIEAASSKATTTANEIKELPYTPDTKDVIAKAQSEVPMLEESANNPKAAIASQAVINDLDGISTPESVAVASLPSEEGVDTEAVLVDRYSKLNDNQLSGEGKAVSEAIKLKGSIDKDASHGSYRITADDAGKESILHYKMRLQELADKPIEELQAIQKALGTVKSVRSLAAKRKNAGKGDYEVADSTKPSETPDPFEDLQDQVELLKMSMGDKFLKDNKLTIYLMENPYLFDWPTYIPLSKMPLSTLRGYVTSNPEGGTDVFINASQVNTRAQIVGTVAHEVVGHFGLLKLFGSKSAYYNYLKGLLMNKALRKDILSLNKRWGVYLNQWMAKNFILDVPPNELYDFEGTLIPEKIALKLADEYMAELCKAKLADKAFIEKEVGFGLSKAQTRTIKRSFRDRIVADFILKVKHFLKSIFGKDMLDKSTEDDILQLVAASIDTTFEYLNPDVLIHTDKFGATPSAIPVGSKNLDAKITQDSEELQGMFELDPNYDPTKVIDVDSKILGDERAFFTAMQSGFGSQSSTIFRRSYAKLRAIAMNNPLIAATTTFGNLPYQDTMKAINTVAKGKMATVEKYAPQAAAALASLNDVQNQIVFEYMTTANADVTTLSNLSEIQQKAVISAKESIRELGKGLVQINPTLEKSFKQYDDAYLHTTYFKYLNQYKGSNKTPFGAWMKRKKQHTTQEQMMLGMIKDVRFLIPETLGMLSRDHTLLTLFDTINKVSSANNTHWVMNSNKLLDYDGRVYNYDQAIDQIEDWNFYLHENDSHTSTQVGFTAEQVAAFRVRVAKFQDFVNSIDNQMTRDLEAAYQKALASNLTKAPDVNTFRQENYVRMSDDRRNGSLRGKYVRKEIAKDLEAFNRAFDLKNKDNIEKFFAEGGTLERVNSYWKTAMIGFNPASMFRNVIGNFTMLDLATSTNSVKLTGMLFKEFMGAIKGQHTDSWKLAESYGLFGVTFSAVELQVLHNEYAKPLQEAYDKWKKYGDSPMESQLSFLNPVLQTISEKVSSSQLGAAKMFAFVEGLFKTVAFKDYVQRWENENKNKYPQGVQSLSETEQKVLYSKAAMHSNDSLIDYSSVPSFIRHLRRLPLGSPFITFTYKALPITIKAAITNPMKFAKYAALPHLLTMLAMSLNDWDDDDVDEAKRKLPEFYRNSSGLTPLPFKDEKGRIQFTNLDPMFPWTQWTTAARKLYEDYEIGGFSELPSSFLNVLHREGGFLGGPVPQVAAALTTGIDTFTGKPIETPGASSTQHLQENLTYSWNLATPAWMHSAGWAANMYHTFIGEPVKDQFGEIKNTAGQVVSDISGFKAIPAQDGGETNLIAKYRKQVQEIKSYQTKVASNYNMSAPERATLLSESNERLKATMKRMQEEFN